MVSIKQTGQMNNKMCLNRCYYRGCQHTFYTEYDACPCSFQCSCIATVWHEECFVVSSVQPDKCPTCDRKPFWRLQTRSWAVENFKIQRKNEKEKEQIKKTQSIDSFVRSNIQRRQKLNGAWKRELGKLKDGYQVVKGTLAYLDSSVPSVNTSTVTEEDVFSDAIEDFERLKLTRVQANDLPLEPLIDVNDILPAQEDDKETEPTCKDKEPAAGTETKMESETAQTPKRTPSSGFNPSLESIEEANCEESIATASDSATAVESHESTTNETAGSDGTETPKPTEERFDQLLGNTLHRSNAISRRIADRVRSKFAFWRRLEQSDSERLLNSAASAGRPEDLAKEETKEGHI